MRFLTLFKNPVLKAKLRQIIFNQAAIVGGCGS